MSRCLGSFLPSCRTLYFPYWTPFVALVVFPTVFFPSSSHPAPAYLLSPGTQWLMAWPPSSHPLLPSSPQRRQPWLLREQMGFPFTLYPTGSSNCFCCKVTWGLLRHYRIPFHGFAVILMQVWASPRLFWLFLCCPLKQRLPLLDYQSLSLSGSFLLWFWAPLFVV